MLPRRSRERVPIHTHTVPPGSGAEEKMFRGGHFWGVDTAVSGWGGRTPAHVFLILSITYIGGGGARDSYAKAALGN